MKEHTFDNLLLLCAVCHARATKGEIDRQAMHAYKANLRLLSGRYSDLERRVLDHFVRHPNAETIPIDRSHQILLEYLIEDGLLELGGPAEGAVWMDTDNRGAVDGPSPNDIVLGPAEWRLTDAGRDVVERLLSGSVLE